jgi:hypothetical protein
VQIWPKDKALVMPAGAGRNEPNSNPFCPPPVGRFKFSWYVCCPVMVVAVCCCYVTYGAHCRVYTALFQTSVC